MPMSKTGPRFGPHVLHTQHENSHVMYTARASMRINSQALHSWKAARFPSSQVSRNSSGVRHAGNSRCECINKVNGLWFGFLNLAFRAKSDPGICNKKYPFYICVFVEPNPLPIVSKLKKYFDQTRFYRKGTLFRSTCKSPANTLSTLTKRGEGWRTLRPNS